MNFKIDEKIFKENTKMIYGVDEIKDSKIWFYQYCTDGLAILSGKNLFFRKEIFRRSTKKLESNYKIEKENGRVKEGDLVLVNVLSGKCIYNISTNESLTIFLSSFPEGYSEWLVVIEKKDKKYISFIKKNPTFSSLFLLKLYLNLISPSEKKSFFGVKFIYDLISIMDNNIQLPRYIQDSLISYIEGTRKRSYNFKSEKLNSFIEEVKNYESGLTELITENGKTFWKVKLSHLLEKGEKILEGKGYVEVDMDTNILNDIGINIVDIIYIQDTLNIFTKYHKPDLHEVFLEKIKEALNMDNVILN